MANQGHFSQFLMKWVLVLIFVMLIANVILMGGMKSFFLTHSLDNEAYDSFYDESLLQNKRHLRVEDAKDLFEFHKNGMDGVHMRLIRHRKLDRLRNKYQEGIKQLNETPGMSDVVKGQLAAQKIKGLHNVDSENLDSDLEFHKAGKKHGAQQKDGSFLHAGSENRKHEAESEFDVRGKTRSILSPRAGNFDRRNEQNSSDIASNKAHKQQQDDIRFKNTDKHINADRKVGMKIRTGVKQIKENPGKSLHQEERTGKSISYNRTSKILDTPCYMTIYPPRGQLGNQLFQLASLLGLAHKYNCIPFIHPSAGFNISKAFDLPKAIFNNMSFQDFYTISSMNTVTSDGIETTKYREFIEFSHHRNWTLDGYFQSYRYFENITDDLQSNLKLKGGAIDEVKHWLARVPPTHVKVGIHVRLQDYISSFQLSLGRVAASPEYLHNAMKFYENRHPLVTFVVVSDDIPWCKTHLSNLTKHIIFSSFSDAGLDLAVMKSCDHSIITVGTYGWWGAWLCGGDVVYYDGYPRPRSKMDRQFVKQDYYPKNWIGMV